MIRVCAYCCEIFGEKEPFKDKRETHGICLLCFPKVMKDIEGQLKEMKGSNVDGNLKNP